MFGGAALDPSTFEADLRESLQPKVLNDVANAFKQRNVRVQRNGVLGASINDPDIMKVDDDGAVRFFNPDTGREFSGDNPRRQAIEWVNDYNADLRDAFNATCRQYEDALVERQAPQMEVVAFAPTFEAMDPVRQQLFDSMIEGYEITDENGDVIGYSCDLNKMNAMMERQIAMLQSIGGGSRQATGAAPASSQQPSQSGPALDMHADNSARSQDKQSPRSVADAMLLIQDRQLEELHEKDRNRKGGRR